MILCGWSGRLDARGVILCGWLGRLDARGVIMCGWSCDRTVCRPDLVHTIIGATLDLLDGPHMIMVQDRGPATVAHRRGPRPTGVGLYSSGPRTDSVDLDDPPAANNGEAPFPIRGGGAGGSRIEIPDPPS
ncbi:hypothetical protein GCM10009687_81260 [Asanoa iriomotensis]|uniref:Uncharacterized protein n=1 Tax=Asanoa iriomotensis TaxID=234613 RepID=A0ABQ4CC54_9ACTN|nr:hypothetical protein Air01nite_61360 [Asanoa iriomotensis]